MYYLPYGQDMGASPNGSKILNKSIVELFPLRASFQTLRKRNFGTQITITCPQHGSNLGSAWLHLQLEMSKESNSRSVHTSKYQKSTNKPPEPPQKNPKKGPRRPSSSSTWRNLPPRTTLEFDSNRQHIVAQQGEQSNMHPA